MSLRNYYCLSKIELVMCSERSFNSTFTAIRKECPYKMYCLIEINLSNKNFMIQRADVCDLISIKLFSDNGRFTACIYEGVLVSP